MDTSAPEHDFNRTFECIYYPAKVENVEKAIQTLGGKNHLSEIMYTITEKLELRFRPDDPYCKPTSGERSPCTGLLLKVKIVKKRKKSGNQTVDIVPQVLGKVTSWFQFKNMCDFQYLPMKTNKDGTADDILPNIEFKRFTQIEDLNRSVELFLPPVFFSKIDTPQMNLKLLHVGRTEEEQEFPDHMIGMTRKSRESNARIINFDREEVPLPYDTSELLTRYIRANLITKEDFDAVQKLFQERPIFSKTVLRCLVDVEQRKLKLILPLVAYYFYTGPFRIMWVRLGYDPRLDKGAAKYQVLDFRLRNALGVKEKYGVRRATLLRLSLKCQRSLENYEGQLPEKFGFFRPGDIPPFRQMFYQFCDIQVPEVEQLLASAPLRDECHEKFGWFADDILDVVREHISSYIVNKLDEMENRTEGVETDDVMDDASVQLEDEEDLDHDYDME